MDDEFGKSLKVWTVPAPRAGLAGRIVAHATVARPSLLVTLREEVTRTLTEWRYGLVYKGAALAACLLIGVGVSLNLQPKPQPTPDLDEVAFIVGI